MSTYDAVLEAVRALEAGGLTASPGALAHWIGMQPDLAYSEQEIAELICRAEEFRLIRFDRAHGRYVVTARGKESLGVEL